MAAATLVGATIVGVSMGQESTYLAQKLMLENDLRKRISGALEKILDDHRYVLDVAVELRFTPTVREEVTFKPAQGAGQVRPTTTPEIGGVAEPTEPEETTRRRSRVTGIPIPGFDFQMEEEREEPERRLPVTDEEAAGEMPPPAHEGAQVISQSYTDISSPVPVIEKIEVSCILPEASSPELIENVRQIIMVASHFDRSRGDELSIMTASFKQRRDERTAEAIILRSIAEKIDQLEEKQAEADAQVSDDWRVELERWKEEERSRQEEERGLWRAELEKLENDRLQREFEQERRALIERDSLRLAQITAEINALRSAPSVGTLSPVEEQALQDEVAAKEREKAQLDSVIEEKLAMLTEAQKEIGNPNRGMSNLPIYLMSAISLLAVIALAAVIIFNGRSRPRYVVPPPWMMRPPGKKKVNKKRIEGDESTGEQPRAAPPPPPPPPAQPVEDPGVLQSEIKSTRESIVSMSVAEPEAATNIIREWLEEEAPAPPEEAAAPAPPEAAPPPEEEGKGKKKKKKK